MQTILDNKKTHSAKNENEEIQAWTSYTYFLFLFMQVLNELIENAKERNLTHRATRQRPI